MVYVFECSLASQDCATLYADRNDYDTSLPIKLPFTNTSCVRDLRLSGAVGRCGFPGAPCILQDDGSDNCAGGGDASDTDFTPICVPDSDGSSTGTCRGEAGAVCTGNVECNWGMGCNNTSIDGIYNSGVCGGAGAYMNNDEADDGLDFARDYCLSGKAHIDHRGDYWLCSDGPPLTIDVPQSSSMPVPPSSSVASSTTSFIPVSSSSSVPVSPSSSVPVSPSSSVPVSPTSPVPVSPSSPTPSPEPKTKVGVIVGPIVAVLFIILLALFCLCRRRRPRRETGAVVGGHYNTAEMEGRASTTASLRQPYDGRDYDYEGSVAAAAAPVYGGQDQPHAQDGADGKGGRSMPPSSYGRYGGEVSGDAASRVQSTFSARRMDGRE